ncbi:hypothetical protein [Mycoplasmopsis californica]|nr:hypothetical protein [Mycoplasmopsis californica]
MAIFTLQKLTSNAEKRYLFQLISLKMDTSISIDNNELSNLIEKEKEEIMEYAKKS